MKNARDAEFRNFTMFVEREGEKGREGGVKGARSMLPRAARGYQP